MQWCWSTILLLLLGCSCGRLGYDATAVDAGISEDATTLDDGGLVWEEFLGSASEDGVSDAPGDVALNGRITIAPNGTPYVLYASNETGNKDIYVKRWTGSSWEGLGGSASPGGISNDAAKSSLGGSDFDAAGNPHVAWMSEDEARSIYYRYWDGSAWVEKFGSAGGRGVSVDANPYWPKLAISPMTDQPLISYETYSVQPGGAPYLKTPGNLGWEGIAGSASTVGVGSESGSASLLQIAVAGDHIYIVWQDIRASGQNINLTVYNPTLGWHSLGNSMSDGGISQSAVVSERPTVRVGSGKIMVAWTEHTAAGPRAYLRSFDGSAWVELDGSASGDGVSGPNSPGSNAEFALDGQGNPFAAWSHAADSDKEIFAARWDGSGWHSATAAGASISETIGESNYPRVAIAPDGRVYVLWEESRADGSVAIYLRSLLL
jgi:hypothetical protein